MGKQSTIKQRNPYVVHAIRRRAGSHTRPYTSERGELNRKDTMYNPNEGDGLGIEGYGNFNEGDGYFTEGSGYAIEGWGLGRREGWNG